MRDDGLGIADGLAILDDVRQLLARRGRGVEQVLVHKRHAGELEEGKDLQPVAIVVGNAEQRRIGVECEHGADSQRTASCLKRTLSGSNCSLQRYLSMSEK